jgi:hypothetical protein
MRWCWGAPHRTRSVCAGPYCSACAEGFFEKGKLCAPCDPGTKDVMCAEHSRAAPPRYIGRCAFGILSRLGIMFGFIALFVVGIFFCPPNTVFAIFDFMAERSFPPVSRT